MVSAQCDAVARAAAVWARQRAAYRSAAQLGLYLRQNLVLHVDSYDASIGALENLSLANREPEFGKLRA